MTANDLHAVLGASGGAGAAIATAAVAAGLPTRSVSRHGEGPEGTEPVAADIATPEGAARAVAGASVVYLAAQPPYHRWTEEFPSMLGAVIDATAEAGAKLVMVDNLYAYGPGTHPITPDSPERATDRKGTVRREMAETLRDAHRSGKLRVAIGRASDYLGVGGTSAITALAVEQAVAGDRARWPGRLDVPHSVSYLPDLGRAFVTLGTSDAADGRAWILAHPPAVTGARFLELVEEALGHPVSKGRVSPAMLRLAAPFHRASRELVGILHQWTEPFVVDDLAFRETFGPVEVTPLEEAVAETIAAIRKAVPAD